MKPKDHDQLVEDLKREYPAASQVPETMKKAREVVDGVLAGWLAGLRPSTRGLIVSRLFDDLAKAGFVILPREPDDGMIEAAMKNGFEGSEDHLKSDYRAMLKAAEGSR